MGESKVGDLRAASSRCLPNQAYDIFEGREGPMRLAPRLGEIVLEPEPLPQARVEGEDHDGTPADHTTHLREGGPRVGEVVQGEHTDGALRATVGQRQPLGGRGHPTDTGSLSSLPPHGRRRLDGDHTVAEASQGGCVVAGPGADVEDLTAFGGPSSRASSRTIRGSACLWRG
jgi:hypothetical protein